REEGPRTVIRGYLHGMSFSSQRWLVAGRRRAMVAKLSWPLLSRQCPPGGVPQQLALARSLFGRHLATGRDLHERLVVHRADVVILLGVRGGIDHAAVRFVLHLGRRGLRFCPGGRLG